MTTGAEIAAWYYATHYDDVADFLARRGAARTGSRS
jgi:hypothetical protein